MQLAERLKLSDPLLLERHRGRRGDVDQEPVWLLHLQGLHQELEASGVQPEQKVAGNAGDPWSAHSEVSGARGTTGTQTDEPRACK